MIIPGNVIFSILLIVGAGFLEYYLSKRESKWPGLILPIFTFLYSLAALFFMAAPPDSSSLLPAIFGVLFIGNIPTLFFLIIYILVRSSGNKKQKEDEEMKKMKIQDL